MTTADAIPLAAAGFAPAGLAFALCALLCRGVGRWWPAYLADFPGGPLRHRVAVPLGGGVAFWGACLGAFGAAALACVVGRAWLPEPVARYVDGAWSRSGEMAVILGLATAVLAAGLATDLFDLGWKPRLALQFAAAATLSAAGTRVTLFWPFSHPLVGGLASALWVVGLVNAFTFLDNMDGLAAGVGLIAALLFAATQAETGSLFAPAALLIIAGGLAGLLPFNRYPARVFLGTGGSGLIGFLLGALTVAGTYYRYGAGESPNSVLSPLLVMAVPCYESAVVFLKWLRDRDPGFLSNPRHYAYRLQGVGLTPRQSVRLLLLVSLGAGLGSLLLRRLDALGTAVLLGQTACLIGVVAVVEVAAVRRPGREGAVAAAEAPPGDVVEAEPGGPAPR